MKIYCNFFAILALSPVSAFVTQRSCTSQTSLYSSQYIENLATSTPQSEDLQNLSVADEENVASLEARLNSLEQGQGTMAEGSKAYSNRGEQIWDSAQKVKCQGGSLKTFTFPSPLLERVKVVLKTDGRPLNAADVDLWNGPDNTPVKMRVYLEDGSERPFMTSIETPRGTNTFAVRNTAHLEFPLDEAVVASSDESPESISEASAMTIQGGALKTFPFDALVQSVQVLLRTDGRPLNSRIELLQGPNNNKQVVELYAEDGIDRPFFMVIKTPGSGNVVRIQNTSPVEFPMTAAVEPYLVGLDETAAFDAVIGGDND